MKVTIEVTTDEIKKPLTGANDEQLSNKLLNEALLELKDKTIEKQLETISLYQNYFLDH